MLYTSPPCLSLFFLQPLSVETLQKRDYRFLCIYLFYRNNFPDFCFNFFFYNNPILLTDLWKSEAVSKISSHNVINYLNFDARTLKRKFLRRIKHVPFRLPEIYFLWQEL